MSIESKFDAKATPAQEMRAVFGKRLGEIIENVIGDSRIKDLFEQAGKHPEEYEGKPTGLVAMDLGVISADTKTALLVAQAAERTLTLAEKAETLSEQMQERREKKEKVPPDDYVRYDDDVFKYVGSERDPQILQQAQGFWMAAQMLYNNEHEAVNGVINNPAYVANAMSQGVDSAQGFKRAAMDLFGKAGGILAQEGHKEAAEKLETLSKSLAKKVQGDGPSPSKVMTNLAWDFGRGGQDLFIVLSDERYLERQPIEDVFDRLAKLTAPGGPQESKPAAKGQKAPASKR
ncbi:MAG: hypothetical protein EP349_07395 [Alphaproteobacteria bacterium]|nr:MAG: hypothetical protein EP349_07395 [Alphaproteobacteria bacterium]